MPQVPSSTARAVACVLIGMAAALARPADACDNDPTPPARRATLYVRDFRFTGNTALPTATLAAALATCRDRALDDHALQRALARIDALYAQAGYATSRATLPDQDVAEGIVEIRIREGFLEHIDVRGTRALDPAYIAGRLRSGVGVPLNVAVLDANLRLLQQERGVGRVRGRLRRGSGPAAAVLEVDVEEVARYTGGLRLANDRAPAVGGVRGAIEGSVRNLFGRGDVIDLIYGHAAGLRDLDARASVPFGPYASELTLRYLNADSELVDEQFAVLGARTEVEGYEFGLNQSVLRTSADQIQLSARLSSRSSTSYLFGRPFSFSPGVVDGEADVRALRLALGWTGRRPRNVVNARLTWSAGLPVLGATVNSGDLPDSRFHALLGQLQWLHALGPRAGALALRADVQATTTPLLPLEKFALGGTGSVRGYRRARFVRDNGWSASLEYRLPLWRSTAGAAPGPELALVTFLDAGRAWNDDDPHERPRLLLAAGPGLRFDLPPTLRAELYWGGWRREAGDGGGDLQDHGVHFVVRARTAR